MVEVGQAEFARAARGVAVTPDQLMQRAQLLAIVSSEAAEEPDAISRYPEVIDVIAGLAERDDLRELFGEDGHDPAAFVTALAEGLAPYREKLLTDAPELIDAMAILSRALRRASYSASDAHESLLT